MDCFGCHVQDHLSSTISQPPLMEKERMRKELFTVTSCYAEALRMCMMFSVCISLCIINLILSFLLSIIVSGGSLNSTYILLLFSIIYIGQFVWNLTGELVYLHSKLDLHRFAGGCWTCLGCKRCINKAFQVRPLQSRPESISLCEWLMVWIYNKVPSSFISPENVT